jgi:hypothetical protein
MIAEMFPVKRRRMDTIQGDPCCIPSQFVLLTTITSTGHVKKERLVIHESDRSQNPGSDKFSRSLPADGIRCRRQRRFFGRIHESERPGFFIV